MGYTGLGWGSGQEHQPIRAGESGGRNGAKSGPTGARKALFRSLERKTRLKERGGRKVSPFDGLRRKTESIKEVTTKFALILLFSIYLSQ